MDLPNDMRSERDNSNPEACTRWLFDLDRKHGREYYQVDETFEQAMNKTSRAIEISSIRKEVTLE